MELYMISRFFFFAFLVTQHVLLSKFVADHQDNLDFYALVALVLIPVSFWIVTLCYEKWPLKQHLGAVWFLYSCVFVAMIGVIFGRAVIEDNKLREEEMATCLRTVNDSGIDAATLATNENSFFDSSKFLQLTLCITPGLMLLLLNSVKDETGTLKQLQLIVVLDLFDGIEMVEVLHKDICDKIPMEWEIAVLVAALLFFLLSFLDVHQVKFQKPNNAGKSEEGNVKIRKKIVVVTVVFQILLNFAFLVIRAVLWNKYEFDSVIFLAKNAIRFVMVVVDVLEVYMNLEPDEGNSAKKEENNTTKKKAKPRETLKMGRINLCTEK